MYSTNLNSYTMNYRELMMGPKQLNIFLIKFEVSFKVNMFSLNDIFFKEKLIFHYDEKCINIVIRNKKKIEIEKKKSN